MEEPIEVTEEAKDLGVIFDSKMSFKAQRLKAQSKASQKAGWVLRTFSTRALGPLRTLWKSLVQPHLDYCGQLWSPVGQRGALEALEAPLRAFTKRISGLESLPYWERLARGGFLSNERRMLITPV